MTPSRFVRDGDTLPSLLRRRLEEKPDARAVCFYEEGGCEWTTRSELAGAVDRVSDLLEREGLEAGSTCAIVLRSDRPAVASVLAVLGRGAIPVLVAPPVLQGGDHIERTILSVVRRTEATHAIVGPGVADVLEHQAPGPRRVTEERVAEALGSDDPESRPAWHEPDPDERAFFQLTSGTTGEPKICVWTHRAVIAALVGMAEAMELSAEDVCCNWTPLYHDMGLVNNFLLCLASGVPLVWMRPTDFVRHPERWLRAMSETGSTVTWSPNFGFALAASRIPDERLTGVRLDGVRSFWNAAERIHLETFEAFAERFEPYGLRPDALRTNYGCAENIGGATFSVPEEPVPVETVDPENLRERGVARETSGSGGVTVVGVGRAAPGIAVRILSEGGRPLGDGEVGRLALRTPSRMEEYLDDEDATREAIRDGWLVTADLAYTRGEEVFWVGRVQERIVINARKYDPSDFERVLFEIEGLRPGCFVAFGTDDPEAGTQALVIVSEVVDPGLVGDPDLVSTVRRRIFTEHGVRPRRVVLVPRGSLPKTSSGKRRHRHFKKRYLETDER